MRPHDTPPKPVLTLRIGVTGHRPNKLSGDSSAYLEQRIEAILQKVQQELRRVREHNGDIYADVEPCLRIVSALAEGADRLVVTAGLRQNCEIMDVLPFARDLYCRDFPAQAARDQFDAMLGAAATVIELDGQYEPLEARNTAYAAVGTSVVDQADLLLAVWDGHAPDGYGGTSDIVNYAIRNGCPVIWLPSEGPWEKYYGDLTRLLLSDRSILIDAGKELIDWIGRSLIPRAGAAGEKSPFASDRSQGGTAWYFSETRPRWQLYRFYDCFRALVTMPSSAAPSSAAPLDSRFPSSTNKASAAAGEARGGASAFDPAAVRRQWADKLASVSSAPGFKDPHLEALATHYAWFDQLSTYYAGLYRSAFLTNYLLAAAAVLAAATATYPGFVVELVSLGAILCLRALGARRDWHRRWIEYRDLAERLRVARYLRIVASPPVTETRLLPHFSPTGGAAAQIDWLHRAIVREIGLPSIAFTRQYLELVREYLIEQEISDQIRYHTENGLRLKRLNQRLHLLSISAFGLAFVVATLHLCLEGFTLNYLSILLPTIGAVLFAIRNQGELVHVSEQSERMAIALTSLRDEIIHSPAAIVDQRSLKEKAQTVAKIMLSETADWQSLFRARPLELPG